MIQSNSLDRLISSLEDRESNNKRHTGARIKKIHKIKRRLSLFMFIGSGLIASGFIATGLLPSQQLATADVARPELIDEGRAVYQSSCISCHGSNLEGIPNRGPSLLGVGEASVYFQVSSGRMPAAKVEAQPLRKPPKLSEEQTEAVSEYVQSLGGGPTVYRTKDGKIAGDSELTTGDPGKGSELYRLNCASCHNFTGQGGALSSGKFAPPLNAATGQQIYDAMQTGPQSMPVFSDRQLSPENKKDIITFIKLVTKKSAPGGYALGGFGPASEGTVMWIVGIGTLVAMAMWIGSRN